MNIAMPKPKGGNDFTLDPKCPHCNQNKNTVKIGYRETKRGIQQRYRCNKCQKTFTDSSIKHVHYPPKIIFSSISTYNLGYTKQQTAKIQKRRFNQNVPIPTIHSWLKRYKDICTIAALRQRYRFDPESIIKSKKLHHVQVYNFKYHDLKLNLAAKNFPAIRMYIKEMFNRCPNDIFKKEGPRCSSLRIDIKPRKVMRSNNAPKLARYALTLSKSNKDRHTRTQDFMLINDSATIAIEIPVFLHPQELSKNMKKELGIDINKVLTGHIDILQVRFNQIHVLDIKPDAKGSDKGSAEQVFLYTLALSKRTNIPLMNFTCAFFDDNNYYQFKPIFN